MEKRIRRMVFLPEMPKLERVAAYARVSTEKDAMLHSLAAQVDYYSTLIRRTPGWEYAGVYVDEGMTGTKGEREGFLNLMNDCREGKIDRVLTKSVSRFARNTVTLLETVRELKTLGIAVFFEEQNIDTLTADGEFLLTILASVAQEESRSASENQKWRVRRYFEAGIPWNGVMLGYRHGEDAYTVVPEEAETVRRIFREYISGSGVLSIAKGLNADGITTRLGHAWRECTVASLLRNCSYEGSLLLQKTFKDSHLTKRKVKNTGELPMYAAEDTHEAIIAPADFEQVQAEIKRRAEKYAPKVVPGTYPFSGKVQCGICGKNYRRKTTHGGPVWICQTYNRLGKAACPSKMVPESVLDDLADKFPPDTVESITAENGNRLTVLLKNGQRIIKTWTDRSRSASWTAEMRAAASKMSTERNQKHDIA